MGRTCLPSRASMPPGSPSFSSSGATHRHDNSVDAFQTFRSLTVAARSTSRTGLASVSPMKIDRGPVASRGHGQSPWHTRTCVPSRVSVPPGSPSFSSSGATHRHDNSVVAFQTFRSLTVAALSASRPTPGTCTRWRFVLVLPRRIWFDHPGAHAPGSPGLLRVSASPWFTPSP